MIDYLERLFAPEASEREEQEEGLMIPRRAVEAEEEPAAVRVLSGEQETVSTSVPVPRADDREEFWQREALRRLDSALSVPEGERESFFVRRPIPEREGEELERRLRRDSRRYDSGFFWY